MVTIKDIARAAGVTPATVSRALSNSPLVKPVTKRKILELVKKLDYSPNIMAKGLVKQKTYNVGLVMPYGGSPVFHSSFFSEIVKGIGMVLNANGLHLLVLVDADGAGSQDYYERLFRGKVVEGIISIYIKSGDRHFAGLEKQKLPFVLIGKCSTRRSVKWVDIDYAKGAFNVVNHLAEQGHRKIAFVNGPGNIASCVEKLEGYLRALRECGLSYDKQIIVERKLNQYGGYEGISDLLNETQGVSAVFFANDTMAIGAIRAIRERGIAIPEELAMVGFDNTPESSVVTPSLSTVAYSLYDCATKAAEMLVKMLNDEPVSNCHVILPTELIIRKSSVELVPQKENSSSSKN